MRSSVEDVGAAPVARRRRLCQAKLAYLRASPARMIRTVCQFPELNYRRSGVGVTQMTDVIRMIQPVGQAIALTPEGRQTRAITRITGVFPIQMIQMTQIHHPDSPKARQEMELMAC